MGMRVRARIPRRPAEPGDGKPRLGTVIRFAPKAGMDGIKELRATGLQVASSKDFKSVKAAVQNDFDGADVQYFERFGIAIVRQQEGALKPRLQRVMAHNIAQAARPERQYRMLGRRATAGHAGFHGGSGPYAARPHQGYLHGYRDGVNHLIEKLLAEGAEGGNRATARFDEATVTWGLEAINVPLTTLTGAGIKVAVLDTGFDDSHPDFAGRTVTKKLFASRSSPDDTDGHGTHCIGTACGALHPASGPRYGIAGEAEIYAGKVLGDDGFGTDRSIIAGMDWAVEQGCHIISMSLGAGTDVGDLPNEDYEQIGQACLDAGTLVIAAAGNESDRPGRINPVGSPANASSIMAVAAIDRAFLPASFSCGGINAGQEVDIAAPGVDILSSLPGGGYDRWDGTSMATPHVAGIAALIAQSDAKYRGWALWARLLQLAKPLSSPARDVGKGLLQMPPK